MSDFVKAEKTTVLGLQQRHGTMTNHSKNRERYIISFRFDDGAGDVTSRSNGTN